MLAPIKEIADGSALLVALVGDRVYPFGMAPQAVQRPYIVWQGVGGNPENYLGELPDVDRYTVQIDVYGVTSASVRQVAEAMRDAVEPVGYVVSWRGESRDNDTMDFRFGFDVDLIVSRYGSVLSS